MTKVLFVEWCANDALGGTLQLDPMTELAYRRIIDMIYASDDQLVDDDDVMQYATKTGTKWKAIKKKLIEVHKKISIVDGFIRQPRCTEKLEKSRENIRQKSEAGKASAEARKALKTIEPDSTAVTTVVPTSVPTNQEPNNQVSKRIVFGGKCLRINLKDWNALEAEHGLTEGQLRSYAISRDDFLQKLPEDDPRRAKPWMPFKQWLKGQCAEG